MAQNIPGAAELRRAMEQAPGARARDLADQLNVAEADLVAARVGRGVTRLASHPDALIPAIATLGEVMALTRNASCVHEKIGQYRSYHPGAHAAMVLDEDIDLRIFPVHWRHAYALCEEGGQGTKRSVQVFDAAGDAVHKVHLRGASDLDAWDCLTQSLAAQDQADTVCLSPRPGVEVPKARADKREALLEGWDALTDTHQFLTLCARLKMNRLGAYRVAGAPRAQKLEVAAVDQVLRAARDTGIAIMVFVGNRGCIQIHSGPVHRLQPMGDWLNILDPGFNLHLRADHVAELYAVTKPTRRGPALSVEGFDARGQLILQMFPVAREGHDSRAPWAEIVATLSPQQQEVPADAV